MSHGIPENNGQNKERGPRSRVLAIEVLHDMTLCSLLFYSLETEEPPSPTNT